MFMMSSMTFLSLVGNSLLECLILFECNDCNHYLNTCLWLCRIHPIIFFMNIDIAEIGNENGAQIAHALLPASHRYLTCLRKFLAKSVMSVPWMEQWMLKSILANPANCHELFQSALWYYFSIDSGCALHNDTLWVFLKPRLTVLVISSASYDRGIVYDSQASLALMPPPFVHCSIR